MTYRRLKVALQEIAVGAPDAVAIAKEAIRDRRPPKSPPKPPKPPAPPRWPESNKIAEFGEWLEAGQPPFRVWGEMTGRSRERAYQRITEGIRKASHPSKKGHPLYIEAKRRSCPYCIRKPAPLGPNGELLDPEGGSA